MQKKCLIGGKTMKCDALVIGGGPGGLTASIYLSRYGHDTILTDTSGCGGEMMNIAEIENYPGFSSISGYTLSDKMEEQARENGVKIEYLYVKEIIKEKDSFKCITDGEEIVSKAIVIATGAKHKMLNIPGEKEYSGKGVSYCATCDGAFFKSKTVSVVGGGDSALSDALYLSNICKKVYLIHRRDTFRAQKVLVDRVYKKENITLLLKKNVLSINGDGEKVNSITLDDNSTLNTDGVFVFVGIVPSSDPFLNLVNTQDGYIITDKNMKTNVDGIYAVGDIRNTPLRQIITSSSDGAIAAKSINEYLLKRE